MPAKRKKMAKAGKTMAKPEEIRRNSMVQSPVYGVANVARSGPYSFILDSNCVVQIVPRRLRCIQDSGGYNFPKISRMTAEPKKIRFGRGASSLLNMMNHISHCDKEVFLIELVRYAAGALYEFSKATLYETDLIDYERRLFIDIFPDKSNKTLSIVDNGIGMTEDDLKNTLFTTHKRSLEAYKKTVVELLKNEIKVDEFYKHGFDSPSLGFLAAYMVADNIDITTKHHEGDREFTLFSTTSERSYSLFVRPCDASSARGTKVTLHLNEAHFEYLDEGRLKGLIDKCTFYDCPYPVSIHVGQNIIQRAADLEEKKKDLDSLKIKFEGLRKLFKEVLGSRVKNVVVSDRIYDLPSVLSLDKQTLEINPRSQLVEDLRQGAERNPEDKELLDMIELQFEVGMSRILLYDLKHDTNNLYRQV